MPELEEPQDDGANFDEWGDDFEPFDAPGPEMTARSGSASDVPTKTASRPEHYEVPIDMTLRGKVERSTTQRVREIVNKLPDDEVGTLLVAVWFREFFGGEPVPEDVAVLVAQAEDEAPERSLRLLELAKDALLASQHRDSAGPSDQVEAGAITGENEEPDAETDWETDEFEDW